MEILCNGKLYVISAPYYKTELTQITSGLTGRPHGNNAVKVIYRDNRLNSDLRVTNSKDYVNPKYIRVRTKEELNDIKTELDKNIGK